MYLFELVFSFPLGKCPGVELLELSYISLFPQPEGVRNRLASWSSRRKEKWPKEKTRSQPCLLPLLRYSRLLAQSTLQLGGDLSSQIRWSFSRSETWNSLQLRTCTLEKEKVMGTSTLPCGIGKGYPQWTQWETIKRCVLTPSASHMVTVRITWALTLVYSGCFKSWPLNHDLVLEREPFQEPIHCVRPYGLSILSAIASSGSSHPLIQAKPPAEKRF